MDDATKQKENQKTFFMADFCEIADIEKKQTRDLINCFKTITFILTTE